MANVTRLRASLLVSVASSTGVSRVPLPPHPCLSLTANCCTEHLGLIEPQWCTAESRPTPFMHAAPQPNPDETNEREDELVADPLSDDTYDLWNNTARKNRAIFQELFRPVPTNLIRSWKDYDVRLCVLLFPWYNRLT